MENYYYSSISELSDHIRDQEVSPVSIVNALLQRIAELNPKLNAFITVLAESAREGAKEAETEIKSGQWRGPLHGIPIGIKDFYDTAGIPTTAAFEHFSDRVPVKDARGVEKLKVAGAIIIGKMNMHELGTGTTGLVSYFGPVRNPWNARYIPGGSSSGSASAVASGMCYATLDTDAIGSCRLPAACCGVIGFKGTYGLISSQGILEGEPPPDEMIRWLSHPGITTRSIEDTALVLNVLAERDEKTNGADYFTALTKTGKMRIGVANNFRSDAEVSNVFSKAVEEISRLGYPMSHSAAPFSHPHEDMSNIEEDRESLAAQAFKDIDVLLLPTTATTIPSVAEASSNPQALSPENTMFANYYGLPAVSIPCGFDSKGLPLGLQVVGKPGDEGTVLRLAYQYQSATEDARRHPIA